MADPHTEPRPCARAGCSRASSEAMTALSTKRCRLCKRELTGDAFSKDRSRKDGLNARCKRCDSECGKRRYRSTVGREPRPYVRRTSSAGVTLQPKPTCCHCDAPAHPKTGICSAERCVSIEAEALVHCNHCHVALWLLEHDCDSIEDHLVLAEDWTWFLTLGQSVDATLLLLAEHGYAMAWEAREWLATA
jgi:hypothetical protein